MRTPSRLIATIALCLAALQSTYAEAQGLKFEPVTRIAATDTGLIEGKVTDERGKPLDGAVISALGGTTAFAVSDSTGQYALKQLPPGPIPGSCASRGFPRRAQHDDQRQAVGAERFFIHAAARKATPARRA